MKKQLVLLSSICVLGAGNLFGQGLFLELNGGYGLSISSNEIAYNSTVNNGATGSSGSDEVVRGSYGAGMNFGLNIGYMFNSNIGFGLNASMLIGQKFESTYTYSSPGYASSSTTTYQGKMTRITPNIILSVGEGKIKPYARLGIALGIGNTITIHDEYSNTDGDSEIFTFQYDQGLAFGTYGEFGLNIGFTDKLSLNVALNGYNMSWAPKHGILTEYKSNGLDMLPFLTTSDKEFEFVDNLTYNSGAVYNESQPSQNLKSYNPFSSLGLNIGIRYSL